MRLFLAVTVACLVSLFTVGSDVVGGPGFEDRAYVEGRFEVERGEIAGGISEALVTTAAGGIAGGISDVTTDSPIGAAAGISEALVTTPNVIGGTGFGGGLRAGNGGLGFITDNIVGGAGDGGYEGFGDGFFSEEGSVNDGQDNQTVGQVAGGDDTDNFVVPGNTDLDNAIDEEIPAYENMGIIAP